MLDAAVVLTEAGAHAARVPLVETDLLAGWLYNPQDTDWTSVHWIGIGGAITAALVYMRARFLWWPFHPLGFQQVKDLDPGHDA